MEEALAWLGVLAVVIAAGWLARRFRRPRETRDPNKLIEQERTSGHYMGGPQ